MKLLVFVSLGSDFHSSSSPSAGSQKETEVAALPTETLKPRGSGASAMPSWACAGQHWAPRIGEEDWGASIQAFPDLAPGRSPAGLVPLSHPPAGGVSGKGRLLGHSAPAQEQEGTDPSRVKAGPGTPGGFSGGVLTCTRLKVSAPLCMTH